MTLVRLLVDARDPAFVAAASPPANRTASWNPDARMPAAFTITSRS
ncbi:MAG TPA: hypothetical protein VMM79_16450 [Longimicrobiales bacterium]|nr:hypothetical protein [Longimicrobiales bacterium]